MLERGESDLLRDRPQGQQVQRQQQDVQEGRPSTFIQMDRLFDEIFKRPFFSLWSTRMGGGEEGEQQIYLPVDIFEDGESVIARAEIPGVRKEDLSVQINVDSITISGKKSNEYRVQEKDFYRCESYYGSFTRTCQLPVETIVDQARAVFRDGVLEVRIPKSLESMKLHSRKLNID